MEIFKIQTPLATNMPKPLALIYNEDKSIFGQVEINNEIESITRGRPKVFAYGKMNLHSKQIELDREAPWQNW